MSVHVYIVATGNDKEQLLDKVLTLYCLFQLMGAWGELSLSLRIIQWKYTGHGDKVPQILNTLWLVAPCSPNSAVATFSAPFHYAPTPHPTDSYLFIPIWQESLTFWILCTLLFNYDIWRDYWSTDLYMATSFFFFFLVTWYTGTGLSRCGWHRISRTLNFRMETVKHYMKSTRCMNTLCVTFRTYVNQNNSFPFVKPWFCGEVAYSS